MRASHCGIGEAMTTHSWSARPCSNRRATPPARRAVLQPRIESIARTGPGILLEPRDRCKAPQPEADSSGHAHPAEAGPGMALLIKTANARTRVWPFRTTRDNTRIHASTPGSGRQDAAARASRRSRAPANAGAAHLPGMQMKFPLHAFFRRACYMPATWSPSGRKMRTPGSLRPSGGFAWLRGLDLNQRPLGYEGKSSRDTSQAEPRNTKKNRHSSPGPVGLSRRPAAAAFGQFSDSARRLRATACGRVSASRIGSPERLGPKRRPREAGCIPLRVAPRHQRTCRGRNRPAGAAWGAGPDARRAC
jgi:hypothetical protein